MQSAKLSVSVVMPIYNEEKYIEECLNSLLRQDYPADSTEFLLLDGRSTDKTRSIIKNYQERYSNIKLLDNPERTAAFAMNRGIREAQGDYIIRADAHSKYDPDYITQCVEYLKKTGADNVGGVLITRGRSYIGKAIALMLSSPFGVGDSSFRIGAEDHYADTVPFGAFRKDAFRCYGLYNERLVRNEDNELNYRIRKNGGKIYLTNAIRVTYFCRDSISELGKMAFASGKWNMITAFLCPGTLRLRHFIPFLFVISLVGLPILALISQLEPVYYIFCLEVLVYLSLDGVFSLVLARIGGFRFFSILLFLFPLFHISYGCGFFAGLKYKKTKIHATDLESLGERYGS